MCSKMRVSIWHTAPLTALHKHAVALAAVLVIGVLEGVALATGHNGTMFSVALSAIGVIVGNVYGRRNAKKED